MKTYYIYHIVGVKIGVTVNIPHRMAEQGFTEWDILETHTDIYEVSDREIQLQKEYGLPVDKVPYWKSVENRNNWVRTEEHKRKISESTQGQTNGNQSQLGKPSHQRKLTFEQAEEIRAKYIPRKYGYAQLAEEYGVFWTAIPPIIKNQTYTK